MKIVEQRIIGTGRADRQRTCRSYGAWMGFRLQRSIHMALLAELFQRTGTRANPRVGGTGSILSHTRVFARCCARDGRGPVKCGHFMPHDFGDCWK